MTVEHDRQGDIRSTFEHTGLLQRPGAQVTAHEDMRRPC